MPTYYILLGVAFGAVSFALQHSIPVRGFAWRHVPARVPLVAQLVMVLVLGAGLFLGDDTQAAALLFAGWVAGSVVGTWTALVWQSRTRAEPPGVHEATTDVPTSAE